MTETVRIRDKNQIILVPKDILNQYKNALQKSPHFTSANIDVHLSFLYSGNRLVIYEFLKWCDATENTRKLTFQPKTA